MKKYFPWMKYIGLEHLHTVLSLYAQSSRLNLCDLFHSFIIWSCLDFFSYVFNMFMSNFLYFHFSKYFYLVCAHFYVFSCIRKLVNKNADMVAEEEHYCLDQWSCVHAYMRKNYLLDKTTKKAGKGLGSLLTCYNYIYIRKSDEYYTW